MVSTWTLSVDKEKDWERLKTHANKESKEGGTKYLATLTRSLSFWASLCRRRSSSRPVKLDTKAFHCKGGSRSERGKPNNLNHADFLCTAENCRKSGPLLLGLSSSIGAFLPHIEGILRVQFFCSNMTKFMAFHLVKSGPASQV